MIEKIDNKRGEQGKDFMKAKFNSDDNLPLKKYESSIISQQLLDLLFKKIESIIHIFFR